MVKSIQKCALLLFVCIYQSFAQNSIASQQTNSVTITISGASSDEGAVFVAMYTDEKKWLDTSESASKYVSKIETVKGSATIKFENVPDGEYAISIYHDENDNGKFDTNFLGIPKEDYACSNGARGKLSPPKWKDALFEVNGDDMTQAIKF